MQMFDIALVEMTCHRRICYDVAHVKVGIAGLYALADNVMLTQQK